MRSITFSRAAKLRLCLLLASTAPASLAAAQTVGEVPAPTGPVTRKTVYEAEFFARYAPRTALDIARRVPGFSIELGDEEIRGFAAAAGNVVINGARPSAKSETLETVLSRIPASRVVRVEVGAGDLYGAEYSSKSQVLNVVLAAGSGIDGNVTASTRRLFTGKLVPNLSGSALIKRGDSSINLSAGSERNDVVEEGSDTLTDADDGSLVEFRRKVNIINDRDPYAAASWALEQAADRSLRVNARYSPGTLYLDQDNRVQEGDGDERHEHLVQDYRDPVFEAGGDITRPLASGAVKLIGLATRRIRDRRETALDRDTLGGFEQLQDAKRNETLARLTWNRQDLRGFSVETGAEAVLNTLDSQVDLFEILPGGEREAIELPINHATVKEKRAEAFFNVGRSLGNALRVDGGLTFEISQLQVRGDTEADRTLKFLKPSLALDWKGPRDWHARLSLRRTVAQLDFYEFISAAELSNGRVNAGNPDLEPQRAWELRATVDRPIFGDGKLKLDLGHDRISMLQDRILTEDGFDAPGNIGDGTRSFASLTLDAPLARLGLTGTRLSLTGQVQRTRVRDPISGEERNFTGFFPDWEYRAELRRDAGAFSYGITVENRAPFTFFRTDEIDSNFNLGPFGTAFVEYRPSARTTVTLDIDNLFDTGASRRRLLFDPNRTAASPDDVEYRERNTHVRFGLTLKRSFGGGGPAAP